MNDPSPSELVNVVHRLKAEIDRLTEQQSNALKSATFIGMTPGEAKEYDARRATILGLVEQLRQLESAQ